MTRKTVSNITDDELSALYDLLEARYPVDTTAAFVTTFDIDSTRSKQRPRFGRGGNVYTPKRTLEAEMAVGWRFKQAARGHRVDGDSAFGVLLTFHGAREGQDVDNMTKLVLDGLNGVCWKDDRQVVEIHARKVTADTPRTEVSIFTVEEASLMARIRTIKPEFWDSPGVETLEPVWRLLYIAMWNWADDSGSGKAEARELMGFAFPRDEEMTLGEFRRGLGEVRRVFGVKFYTVGGRSFYSIPSWEKHQRIDKRSASRWPSPDDGIEYDPTTNTPVDLHVSETPRVPAESPPSVQRNSGAGTGEQGNRGTGDNPPASPSEPAAETVQGELFDDDDTTSERQVSTAVAVAEPVTGGAIVKALIDACRSKGVELPKRLIGQYGKAIKDLLNEDYSPQQIWAALSLMAEENVLNRPSLLPNKIVSVQTGPERAPARTIRSTTDDRVTGWQALAATLGGAA